MEFSPKKNNHPVYLKLKDHKWNFLQEKNNQPVYLKLKDHKKKQTRNE